MFGATVSESRVNGNLCWKTGLPQPNGVGYSAQIHLDPLANTLAADEFNLPASGNLAIFTSEDLSRAEVSEVVGLLLWDVVVVFGDGGGGGAMRVKSAVSRR